MYKFRPAILSGKIKLPYSKSTMHRALICALLAQDISKINGINLCDDVQATIEILENINCKVIYEENTIEIDSSNLKYDGTILDARESGSTLRLMIPALLHLFGEIKITGSEKLMQRPLDAYYILFEEDEIFYNLENNILYAKGKFNPGIKIVDNSKSSQFVSGMMLILPFYKYSGIEFVKHDSSMGYIELTMQVMHQFGLNLKFSDIKTIRNIGGNYGSTIYNNEICESSKAFWDVANCYNNFIEYVEENKYTLQPDVKIASYINKKCDEIDMDKHPDLLPILLVWAILNNNEIKFKNCHRLIYKESDRLNLMVDQLVKQGAIIKIVGKKDIIFYSSNLKKELEFKVYNDHRLAMSFIILSTFGFIVKIDNVECINKSYPNFLNDYKKLGGNIE